ncbi:MAG TPA: diphosphate--fructose-6-phosphate 1-phosphotransferase [Mycobacterium sp.]|nr:diphosphate--fructose-6-phosphate 1-phosphotransferase [Mycobacterium sp.]
MNATTTNGIGYPLATYRYVRLLLIAIVAGLLASVVLTAAPRNCWQNSISAFYFTTSHAVFIAALCAAGACMIAYKGTTRAEDVLLNFSGFLAFVVAFVPTASPTNNPKDTAAPVCGLWLPTLDTASAAVSNNIVALLIATVAGVAVYLFVADRAKPAPVSEIPYGGAENGGPVARIAGFVLRAAQVVAPVVVVIALVAGLVWFAVDRRSFTVNGHGAAAIGLFTGMIAVVILYACYAAQHFCRCASRGRFAAFYLAIAVAMTATLIAVTALHVGLPTWNHWILALETLLILEFSAFWTVQTIDSWNGPYQPAVTKDSQQASGNDASASAGTRTD